MDTTLNTSISWENQTANQSKIISSESRVTTFINSQKKNETAWFFISMMVQGIFFLPLPALLIYSFNAPAYILLFTLGLFFANIIAGMSSAGVKVLIYLATATVIVHLLLLAIFII